MTPPNWAKFPDATHFTAKYDDSGMWCDVFWLMKDGYAVRAWQVENDTSVKVFERPYLLSDCIDRMIARPSPDEIAEDIAEAEREEIRAIIEHTKLMGGDVAIALHAQGYRKQVIP